MKGARRLFSAALALLVLAACQNSVGGGNDTSTVGIPITAVEITVTSPAAGESPSNAASGTGNFSVGAVTWSPGHGLFAGSTAYKASVTLTANTGYTFNSTYRVAAPAPASPINAKINGKPAAIDGNSGDAITLSYTFAATDNSTPYLTVTFNSNGGTPVGSISVTSGGTIGRPSDPAKTGYDCKFDGWYKEPGLTTLWSFTTDTVTADTTLYAKWSEYNLGDEGPGGGIIFFKDKTAYPGGFTMTDTGTPAFYLEAAQNDQGTLAWASPSYYSTIITDMTNIAWQSGTPPYDTTNAEYLAHGAIGTGRKNTALILATDSAAPVALATRGTIGSKNDWFLPSLEELNQLYINRSYVGNMTTTYWSSSQYDTNYAWYQGFSNGHQANGNKASTYNVRSVRAF